MNFALKISKIGKIEVHSSQKWWNANSRSPLFHVNFYHHLSLVWASLYLTELKFIKKKLGWSVRSKSYLIANKFRKKIPRNDWVCNFILKVSEFWVVFQKQYFITKEIKRKVYLPWSDGHNSEFFGVFSRFGNGWPYVWTYPFDHVFDWILTPKHTTNT